ncbi:MAG: SOS response-associated peptidase [Acidimicrobiales bacterium]
MCGRFVSSSPPDQLAKYFDVEALGESLLDPNYNVAPTNDVYAVLESGGLRRMEPLHWGLVPFWAKELKIGNRMINARAETLATKNAFRSAFKKRRCIVPADGFFEWQKIEGSKTKQPHYIHREDGEPLAFAGLWEVWRGPDRDRDEAVTSCTIITTSANTTMEKIHDRMPVILPPSAYDAWLDRDDDDVETLGKLLVPAPDALLTMHTVSTDVNKVQNKGPELIEYVDPSSGDPQGSLL